MSLIFENSILGIKDVDLTKRRVEGYFAAFGNIDSDGDVMVKGAFSKTINENKSRIAHLLQHDVTKPIGLLIELEEDEKGLRFVSELSKSTLGNDTLIQYQEGILREHSVGFNTIKGMAQKDFYEIQEVKLWEGSTVTFGANSLTPVIGIKSEDERASETLQAIDRLQKFLRHTTISDESARLLEFELEKLKSIQSLKLIEPLKALEKDEPIFDIDKFKNLLIQKTL